MASGQGRLTRKPITGSGMLPVADTDTDTGLPDRRPTHLQVAGPAAVARAGDDDPADTGPVPAGSLPGPGETGPVEQLVVDPAADKTRQATVSIAIEVRDRFDNYLDAVRPRLTNTALVNAALQAAVGRFDALIQARKPQQQPGVLFGGPAGGRRRSTTEARRTLQLAFYPTYGEAELLRRIAEENDTSMSGVVEAALDDYLPSAEEIAAMRRGSGARPSAARRV